MAASLLLFAAAALTPQVSALEADKRSPERSKPNTLQVQTTIPPPSRLLLEQDIQELFYVQLMHVFKSRGYTGAFEEVRYYEEPSPECWLLKIDVTELRRDPIGNIACTFVATLQTATAKRDLGSYRSTALPGTVTPGPGGSNNAFETAVASALTQLYDAIAKTELVPGIRPKA